VGGSLHLKAWHSGLLGVQVAELIKHQSLPGILACGGEFAIYTEKLSDLPSLNAESRFQQHRDSATWL
jgi:hypothetical protein